MAINWENCGNSTGNDYGTSREKSPFAPDRLCHQLFNVVTRQKSFVTHELYVLWIAIWIASTSFKYKICISNSREFSFFFLLNFTLASRPTLYVYKIIYPPISWYCDLSIGTRGRRRGIQFDRRKIAGKIKRFKGVPERLLIWRFAKNFTLAHVRAPLGVVLI